MKKIFDLKYVSTFLLLFSLVFVSLPQSILAQTATASVEDYSQALKIIEEKTEARRLELGIPGMSLAIVKDGKIIFAKGFGYKDFANKVAVTPETQFAIGSATKAFTGLSVLMTQDEGKLSLDDSPKKYLPYFGMYDPETDKNITIRDLLSHSSGLNRTDLAMISGKLNRAELIQVAGQAKPTAKLREKFQYQNIMFTAAGEIVAQTQKMPWEKFIVKSIFKPLGMNNTTISMKAMEKTKDHSLGYNYNFDTKETKLLPYRDIDEVAPAGSINSSANDMAKWLQFILAGGSANGKRLVSEKGYQEWIKPQMTIGAKASYGLGWFLQDWNGLKVVQHGGNIDGFNSMVAMIPEKNLGFVMLTNVSASSLGSDLMPLVWQNILEPRKADEAVKLSAKTMQFMVGKYHLAAAGLDFDVKIDGDKLVMAVPGQPTYTLERIAPRQFKLAGAPDGFSVKFSPETGDATEMFLTQPQGNFTLPRVTAEPAKSGSATSAAALELIGGYVSETSGAPVEIKKTGDAVSLNIPGQQPHMLLDKAKDQFNMPPLPDTYWLKVGRDDKGNVAKISVVQPEGEFAFRKLTAEESAIAISVDDLMQKAIEAAGGEENIKKLTSRVSTFDMDMENQGVKGFGTSWTKAPNKSATETIFTALSKPIGSGYEYFDGTKGEEMYSFSPRDEYTGKRLEDVKLGADFYSGLNWTAKIKKIEVIGKRKVGDEEAYVVVFEPENASKFTEYYSTKSFLLLKREGSISSSTSNVSLPYWVTFEDYRDVDGIKIPFKTTSYNSGNGTTVTRLKTVKHNLPIADSVFEMKKIK